MAAPAGEGADVIGMEDDAAALHLAHLLEGRPWHRLPPTALLRLLNILCYDIAQAGLFACNPPPCCLCTDAVAGPHRLRGSLLHPAGCRPLAAPSPTACFAALAC